MEEKWRVCFYFDLGSSVLQKPREIISPSLIFFPFVFVTRKIKVCGVD